MGKTGPDRFRVASAPCLKAWRDRSAEGRAEATALPAWIKPQLTKLVDQPPDGPEWLHEIKFDGCRLHARLDRGAVRLLTRTGLDWTRKYPAIAMAVRKASALGTIRVFGSQKRSRRSLAPVAANGRR